MSDNNHASAHLKCMQVVIMQQRINSVIFHNYSIFASKSPFLLVNQDECTQYNKMQMLTLVISLNLVEFRGLNKSLPNILWRFSEACPSNLLARRGFSFPFDNFKSTHSRSPSNILFRATLNEKWSLHT